MSEEPPKVPAPDVATRIGGQPSWLAEPTWPMSGELDVPMTFLGQVVLRESPLALAYLFMTQDDEGDGLETWDPHGGENAVVIHPDGAAGADVRTEPRRTGPGLVDDDGAPFQQVVGTGTSAAQVGGAPSWVQGDEHPGAGWRLTLQLDSTQIPAYINFGDSGVGYAFVTDDLTRGVLLWQGA